MARKVFPTKISEDLIDSLKKTAGLFGISTNQLAELILENGVTEIQQQMQKGQRSFRFLARTNTETNLIKMLPPDPQEPRPGIGHIDESMEGPGLK